MGLDGAGAHDAAAAFRSIDRQLVHVGDGRGKKAVVKNRVSRDVSCDFDSVREAAQNDFKCFYFLQQVKGDVAGVTLRVSLVLMTLLFIWN